MGLYTSFLINMTWNFSRKWWVKRRGFSFFRTAKPDMYLFHLRPFNFFLPLIETVPALAPSQLYRNLLTFKTCTVPNHGLCTETSQYNPVSLIFECDGWFYCSIFGAKNKLLLGWRSLSVGALMQMIGMQHILKHGALIWGVIWGAPQIISKCYWYSDIQWLITCSQAIS